MNSLHNTGISRNRPFFRENPSEDVCKFSSLQGKFPTRTSRGIYLREQGIVSALWTGQGLCAKSIRARGRASREVKIVRVPASNARAEPVNSSEPPGGFFRSLGRGRPTGGEEKVSPAHHKAALTAERVRALAEALSRSLTTMWGFSFTRR